MSSEEKQALLAELAGAAEKRNWNDEGGFWPTMMKVPGALKADRGAP